MSHHGNHGPDRRREPRRTDTGMRGRVRPGHRLIIVDLSFSGALVEAGRPLSPGSLVHVLLETDLQRGILAARVLRCAVAAIDSQGGVIYRAALLFTERCDWVREALGDGAGERTTGMRWSEQSGSVLVQVAVALLAILALSGFVVDSGVMWVSRAQAQNAADAGALAGAISLAFDSPTDQTAARARARAVAKRNHVWTEEPDVLDSDITFPACPPGAPGLPDTCVKVNVFRNQRAGGNPLPTLLLPLVGITNQGVRATGMAQVLAGDSASCIKPFALPDKWLDYRDTPQDNEWTWDDTFERYEPNGNRRGTVMSPADVYIPPGQPGHTGFTIENDYGRRLVIKPGDTTNAISSGWYFPVVINPIEGPGGATYRENIWTCDGTVVGPGTLLQTEPGNMVGPTRQGVSALMARDPSAWWDRSMNHGRGGPRDGCMATGACGISPRLIALALFNPDIYDSGRTSGRGNLVVTKIMGFWLDGMTDDDSVMGYITHYPSVAAGTLSTDTSATFLRTVALVR